MKGSGYMGFGSHGVCVKVGTVLRGLAPKADPRAGLGSSRSSSVTGQPGADGRWLGLSLPETIMAAVEGMVWRRGLSPALVPRPVLQPLSLAVPRPWLLNPWAGWPGPLSPTGWCHPEGGTAGAPWQALGDGSGWAGLWEGRQSRGPHVGRVPDVTWEPGGVSRGKAAPRERPRVPVGRLPARCGFNNRVCCSYLLAARLPPGPVQAHGSEPPGHWDLAQVQPRPPGGTGPRHRRSTLAPGVQLGDSTRGRGLGRPGHSEEDRPPGGVRVKVSEDRQPHLCPEPELLLPVLAGAGLQGACDPSCLSGVCAPTWQACVRPNWLQPVC